MAVTETEVGMLVEAKCRSQDWGLSSGLRAVPLPCAWLPWLRGWAFPGEMRPASAKPF